MSSTVWSAMKQYPSPDGRARHKTGEPEQRARSEASGRYSDENEQDWARISSVSFYCGR